MAEHASLGNWDGWNKSKGAESNGDPGMIDAGKMATVRTALRRLAFTSGGSKGAVAVSNGREHIGGATDLIRMEPRAYSSLSCFYITISTNFRRDSQSRIMSEVC